MNSAKLYVQARMQPASCMPSGHVIRHLLYLAVHCHSMHVTLIATISAPSLYDIAAWAGLVHVPMSLWARTDAQGESSPAHVPMSPSGEDRCAGEESGSIQNSPEVSGRFWRFLGVSGMMLLESSRRRGFLYVRVDGTLFNLLTSHCCEKGPCSVTSLVDILCGEHSPSVPFLDPVQVAVAFV